MALLQNTAARNSRQEGNNLTVPLSGAADVPPRTERELRAFAVMECFDQANDAHASDPPLPTPVMLGLISYRMSTQLQLDCIIGDERISNMIELNALKTPGCVMQD